MIVPLLALLLANPGPLAGDRLAARVAIEEQSACRTLSGGYFLSFSLNVAFGVEEGLPLGVVPGGGRVVRAEVTYDEDTQASAAFVEAGGATAPEAVAPERADRVLVGPGSAAHGRAAAWIPLSTEPADWPAALLPGDYHVTFELRVPVVDAAGDRRDSPPIATAPLAIRIPDPTSVQECPFDAAPRGLLLAS